MTTARTFIVDTNVLVAGLVTANPDSPTAMIVDAMLDGRLIFVLSPDLLSEYRTVLLRPKLRSLHGLIEEEVDVFLTEITANAIWFDPPDVASEEAPDPGDEHLWRLLDVAKTAILITGDRLLCENPPEERSMISPKSYIELFY